MRRGVLTLPRTGLSLRTMARIAAPAGGLFGSLRLRQDATTATADADYARMLTLPTNFGAAEFTFALLVRLETLTAGAGGGTSLANWFNGNPTRYGASDWWFSGNFLLDGHNNTTYQNGTCSLQFFNSGAPRWTFGDGSSGGSGGVWGIQNSTVNLRDSAAHWIVCVRRWNGVSNADLELWTDGTLRDTQTTALRTNMWTTYWQNWTGFPETGWMLGAEKRHILSAGGFWEDFKGWVGRIVFWNRALSSSEIANLPTTIPATDLSGDYRMRAPDGSNRIYSEVVGTEFMTVTAGTSGAIWTSEVP